MIGFFIALLSGALMSIQGVFNTQVTKTTGVWVSNGWVQIPAFVVCLAAWLFTGRQSIAAIGKVEPKYMLLGGVIAQHTSYSWAFTLGTILLCIGLTLFFLWAGPYFDRNKLR